MPFVQSLNLFEKYRFAIIQLHSVTCDTAGNTVRRFVSYPRIYSIYTVHLDFIFFHLFLRNRRRRSISVGSYIKSVVRVKTTTIMTCPENNLFPVFSLHRLSIVFSAGPTMFVVSGVNCCCLICPQTRGVPYSRLSSRTSAACTLGKCVPIYLARVAAITQTHPPATLVLVTQGRNEIGYND